MEQLGKIQAWLFMDEQDPTVLAVYKGNNQTSSKCKLGNGFHTIWKC